MSHNQHGSSFARVLRIQIQADTENREQTFHFSEPAFETAEHHETILKPNDAKSERVILHWPLERRAFFQELLVIKGLEGISVEPRKLVLRFVNIEHRKNAWGALQRMLPAYFPNAQYRGQ